MMKSFIEESGERMPDGSICGIYTLTNHSGIQVSVINFGATITSIKIPLENSTTDVVLGFDKAEDYKMSFEKSGSPYYGSVIGRFAGRIKAGKFSLDGKSIQLNQNFYGHHLHGGQKGFSNVLWQTFKINDGNEPSVTFTYTSKSGEENYPGTLTAFVKYTLTEKNELVVEYQATTDEDTIVNLTQHSYFNLDGHDGNVTNQELLINADKILETDAENIPTGNFIQLDGHFYDFRTFKSCPEKIDNCFVVKSDNEPCTILISRKNRLKMSVFTNHPGIQVYVGGTYEGELSTKQNVKYHNTSGVCFETQNFPDAPNHLNFPSAILRKGEKYHHRTMFRFERM